MIAYDQCGINKCKFKEYAIPSLVIVHLEEEIEQGCFCLTILTLIYIWNLNGTLFGICIK